ncbi:YolD-like family protein [Bacillus cereus]|uniref:YolD-like family protein n=1 Tax=Bacillus cereus TaxID=1396 RepID=UPI0018CE300C|nr:YolD-like family protein [Bacillus cereus]MBG9615215.1 hypothetical protein [Bacillus cereus]
MSDNFIPRGRGMQKFLAFASMPEQFEGIRQLLQEQIKIDKPILDEQQKEEIERVFWQALRTQCEGDLYYFRDGYIHHEIVTIQRIDGQNQKILTTDAFQFQHWFSFDEIIDFQISV